MRTNKTWLHVLIAGVLAIIETVLLKNIEVLGARPDLSLIYIVFASLQLGSFYGQFPGFMSGLAQDILSLAPLGFHALIKTVISYLAGIFKGKVFLDAILFPLLLVAVATIIKAILAFLIGVIFISSDFAWSIFGINFLVELGMNSFLAPFLYGFFKLIGVFQAVRSER